MVLLTMKVEGRMLKHLSNNAFLHIIDIFQNSQFRLKSLWIPYYSYIMTPIITKINAKRTRYNKRHNPEIYYASSISNEILIVSSVKTTLYLGISELDLS